MQNTERSAIKDTLHYLYWETHPLEGHRDYSGIRVIVAPDKETACLAMGWLLVNAFHRAVRVIWQKEEK